MTPSELHKSVTKVITEETGITVSWAQAERPLTLLEIGHIEGRLRSLLAEEYFKTAKRQQELYRQRAAAARA